LSIDKNIAAWKIGVMIERLLLRVVEAAEALGVSRAKAYELIASGEIPSVKLGGCVRVPLAALEVWIAERVNERERIARRS
jgi:excisionase family DNA binding protein